jgi:alpha-amylase
VDRWHNAVGTAKRANFWTDGDNVIAFSKGNRGWAGFNNGAAAQTVTVQTGLPKGSYCNVVTGGRSGAGCAGGAAPVSVNAGGVATVTLGSLDAVALDRANRL